MILSDTDLEKLTGGAAQNYVFTCPYCKQNVDMRVNAEVVTCLSCHRTLLDMNRIKRKKGAGIHDA